MIDHGRVITYDRRSFIRNGRPFIVLSGSVHYIRVHPSRWEQLFQTFHDAALNTIETCKCHVPLSCGLFLSRTFLNISNAIFAISKMFFGVNMSNLLR